MSRTTTRHAIGSGPLVRREDALMTAQVGGELVGMNLAQGACYGFNGVATRIWALLAEPRTLDSLCEQLRAEYDVDEQQCRAEVAALLEELHAEGLIRTADSE